MEFVRARRVPLRAHFFTFFWCVASSAFLRFRPGAPLLASGFPAIANYGFAHAGETKESPRGIHDLAARRWGAGPAVELGDSPDTDKGLVSLGFEAYQIQCASRVPYFA